MGHDSDRIDLWRYKAGYHGRVFTNVKNNIRTTSHASFQ